MKPYLLSIFILLVSYTNACDCITPGIKGRYLSSDVVIKGTVLSKKLYADNDTITNYNKETGQVEEIIVKHDKKAYFEYVINVEKVYKGRASQSVIKVRTEAYTNCSSNFEIEYDYLIFLNKKGRKYWTNLCSGNEIVNTEYERELEKLKKSTHNNG